MGEVFSESASRNTGFRRITLDHLALDELAKRFQGLPGEARSPTQVLGALKAAAPFLRLPRRVVDAVDWLFKFTTARDWEPDSRPIVWPAARTQQEDLGLSRTQAKVLNRRLVTLGLVAMRDSPNGRRGGRRDAKGKIVEAYGFDLSPLALRYAEFLAIADQGRAVREEMKALRRRRTIARRGITQILAAVAEHELEDGDWRSLASQSSEIAQALDRVTRPAEMAAGVESLERRFREAEARLKQHLEEQAETKDSTPQGPENRPHQYNYKAPTDSQEYVIARQEKSRREPAVQDQGDAGVLGEAALGSVRLRPDELLDLAPRLRDYVTTPRPGWAELGEAANWLAGEMGISRALWARACHSLGRPAAVAAVAIVSTKPKSFFVNGSGGYFHAMLERAREGNLHLDRTIWSLRKRQQ